MRKGSCYSCGVLHKDEAFPPRKRGELLLCASCKVEWPRELERIDRCLEHRRDPYRQVTTRAGLARHMRYYSLGGRQGDLVQLAEALRR
jgi:hypothetical protein